MSTEITQREMYGLELFESPKPYFSVNPDTREIELVGLDRTLETIRTLRENVETSTLDSEEDRKALSEARAASNKYTIEIKSQLKAFETEMFDSPRAALKSLEGEVSLLSRAFKTRLDVIENEYRAEKQLAIEKIMAQALLYRLGNPLTLDDVFNARWLNRSIGEKTIVEELDARLNAFTIIKSLHPDETDESLKNRLVSAQWDLTKAEMALAAEKAQIEEEFLVDEAVKTEPAKTEKRVETVTVVVTFPASEVETFVRLASERGWSYSVER